MGHYVATQQIITPYSLPMFREERQKSTKKQAEKARRDPVKSHRPEMPLGMKGTGGRVQTVNHAAVLHVETDKHKEQRRPHRPEGTNPETRQGFRGEPLLDRARVQEDSAEADME